MNLGNKQDFTKLKGRFLDRKWIGTAHTDPFSQFKKKHHQNSIL